MISALLSNRALTDHRDVSHIESTHTATARDVQYIPVADVTPSPWQPRTSFDHNEADFVALVENIRRHGLILPVAVRAHLDGSYELIAGERRLRACRDLGHTTIVAHIHRGLTDTAARAMTITENLARKDLTTLEEARAVGALQDLHRTEGLPDDVRSIGASVGRSKSLVAQLIQINRRVTDAIIVLVRETYGDLAAKDASSAPKSTLLKAAEQATPAGVAHVLAGSHPKLRGTDVGDAGGPTSNHSNARRPDAPLVRGVDKTAAAQQPAAFTVSWSETKRVRIFTSSPLHMLTPDAAQEFLDAMEPLLTTLRQRATTAA